MLKPMRFLIVDGVCMDQRCDTRDKRHEPGLENLGYAGPDLHKPR